MSRSAVRIVLGTMEMGRRANEAQSAEMVDIFLSRGHRELDTALMYCGGKTEKILGAMPTTHDASKVSVHTKVNPWSPNGLKPESVSRQFSNCLANLKTESVDVLYLHAPDHATPIEHTLAAVDALHKAGKFKELGLSNYASWEVAEIYYLCKQNGWVLPTLYQGMYNAITREVEKELFPCMKRLGIRFYVYNPLAGGLLTGRYVYEDAEKEPAGRFFGNNWAEAYRTRYWKQSNFDSIELVKTALDGAYGSNKVSLAEASLRWLTHHSYLKGEHGDAVIVGASTTKHLIANLDALECAEPLAESVVEAFNRAWQNVRGECPVYFR
eukprot:Opistho-2@58798